ncbi:TonB-dependent receptor [Sphingomicrobium clamense]|uniref:TonB-dependent receptor n=1 Tax=Sphingomicrobium clamense TaxID=2851013 RepID=A0ABS6V6J1_9SPHN|nr:TonB-dependent receptor [Sphingomicrobium sp. B8]MBW0145180.1 TonB-dependent receptor [Sphingomicrobium sp. B8]
MFDLPPIDAEFPDEKIVITASRDEVDADATSDAISLLEPETLDQLGEARVVPLLRLLPSVALAETGPAGTQAQVRIRGAEASHTLLFIDGIKANDPAAGNEARFELLGDSAGDALELKRGPQSALWGAEAIGGVVALRSAAAEARSVSAFGEYGSDDFQRLSSRFAAGGETGQLVAAVGYQRSDGIDSFGDGGEKDGYSLFTARVAGELDLSTGITLETSGFAIDGKSEFDGFDPVFFTRADTDDETDNRLAAGRVGLSLTDIGVDRARFGISYLDSQNINFTDGAETNRTAADRLTVNAQLAEDIGNFTLISAVDHEAEDFEADDVAFGGLTRQDVSRERTGILAEARWTHDRLTADIAVRHDMFEGSSNATSISGGLLYALDDRFSLFANYGEGIAQPSFYDLFGFFPGSFVGNPQVKPERSRGGDIGVRYADDRLSGAVTIFHQRLDNEIVSIFDGINFTSSVINAQGKSDRWGVEVEAGARLSDALSVSANYSYLDADEPDVSGADLAETRRPRHRAAIHATGNVDRLSYGASLAIVGARDDVDFDLWPASRVTLDSYALLSARIGYRLNDTLELNVRGTNLTDSDYQDVVGYNTQGRAVFAGIRITG